ncbi:MAG: M23 family metallopeptidase [Campylobacterota bacterium]|nr:M23 family metallopeptidase [Campylobacterota bacterium]
MYINVWVNLKKPLKISIDDTSGLKSYRVILKTSNGETVLNDENFMSPQSLVSLNVKPPRSIYAVKDKVIKLVVQATDMSNWNFANGNTVEQEYKLQIDKRRPRLNIVNHSYKISKGGSAVVIFKADDENLDEIYIESNNGKNFKVQEFYKDGYYISLLAWPVTDDSFKATVVAKDFAGNIAKSYIPLYLKEKYYKVSNIRLKDKFLKGKIADLAEEFVETQGVENSLEQFRIINEDVRAKNELLIHELASKVPDERVSDFKINKMYPLKNAQVVARFGDHRKYSYDGDAISESYHLGLDLASNSMAKINPQNSGEVVYADYNGLYGHMPMIHHGLGLYTLYGHCSSLKVNSDEHFNAKGVVANTGKSGYAMGDHLHFGVLVQGIEVRPQEWMDKDWIRINITNVIKSAKKIIDRN